MPGRGRNGRWGTPRAATPASPGPTTRRVRPPVQRAARIVDAQSHRGVDVVRGGHPARRRVEREVHEHRDRTGHDHARDVRDHADVLAEGLEEADGLAQGRPIDPGGGCQGDPGRGAVVQREIEVDDGHPGLVGGRTVRQEQPRTAGELDPARKARDGVVLTEDLDTGLLDQTGERVGREESAVHGDGHGRRCGPFRPRPGARCGVLAVREPAPARLAAQPPRLHQPALRERGREPRVLEEGLPYGPGDGLVDVLADQIGQFEGAHPEAAGLTQHRVDRGGVGGPLLVHPERLGVVGAGDAVDDEARGVRAAHRSLAPRACCLERAPRAVVVRREPADDLHERQKGGGIEEVEPDQTAGAAQLTGDGRDGEGGGVRGEQTVVGDDVLQGREQFLLDGELFQNGLDDQSGVGQLGDLHGRTEPGGRGVARRGVEPALLDQPVQTPGEGRGGLFRTARHGVVEPYGMAA